MPYSWDDKFDYDVNSKAGFSFEDARKSYDEIAIAKNEQKVFYTYKSEFLKTDSAYPIIIGIDTTGSMQEWPKTFFEKLPLLYKEAVKYFSDCEISFQAINDFYADGEDNALQPAPFGKGPELDQLIGQLLPIGGGGGKQTESYEMFAAYNLFMEAANAKIKPVAIILGDETPFEFIPEKVAEYYDLGKSQQVSTKSVFEKFHEKFDAFLVRKPYYGIGKDDAIINVWKNTALFPGERILNIEDPKRVVDVILGIMAILTSKTVGFEEELIKRQNKEQVKEVLDSMKSLKELYIKNTPGSESGGKTKGKGTGK